MKLTSDFVNRSRMGNEERKQNAGECRGGTSPSGCIECANHYYFRSRTEKSLSRPVSCISPSIMALKRGAGVGWKGSIESIIGKRAVVTRQPFAPVYRVRPIKGLLSPYAKNLAFTIAAFTNAHTFVRMSMKSSPKRLFFNYAISN